MSAERSIPHLRDIFGLSTYTSSTHHNNDNFAASHYGNDNSNLSNNNCDGSSSIPSIDIMKKQSKRKQRDNNSKTLTSGDVKTLERHLSMKKTIRKKIMRDLQQAFVDDPNEFKVDNSNSEHLKSEINAEALRFGEHPTKKSDNFLVMLRGEQRNSYDYKKQVQNLDYDYDSPEPQHHQQQSNSSSSGGGGRDEKQSFWKRLTNKNKSKR